jgi:hypothetical protein
MICEKCKTENPDENKFCGSCGAALIAIPAAVAVPGEDGVYFCNRHKKATTRVRCGRCDAAVCPTCMVYTPAGVRCRDCARNKVAVRPMGVLNEAGRALDNVASSSCGRRIWYLVLFDLILSLFRGFGE